MINSKLAERKQRPDIAVYNYYDSKELLLDTTITYLWSKTNLTGSSEKAGFAASTKKKEKDEKYLLKANNLGHLFRPIAIVVLEDGENELRRS